MEYCKPDRSASLFLNPNNNLTQSQQTLQLPTTKVNSIQTLKISPQPQKGHLPNNTFPQAPSCQIMCNMNTTGPYSFI